MHRPPRDCAVRRRAAPRPAFARACRGYPTPADRMHHRTAATETMQQAFEPRRQSGVGCVLSDRDMLDPGIEHDRDHRRTAAIGLAPAYDAAAGGYPHQQHVHVGPRLARELRRWRPGIQGKAKHNGVDICDGGGRHCGSLLRRYRQRQNAAGATNRAHFPVFGKRLRARHLWELSPGCGVGPLSCVRGRADPTLASSTTTR